eukprot:10332105-Heterocapsa_arctica.AAC.1
MSAVSNTSVMCIAPCTGQDRPQLQMSISHKGMGCGKCTVFAQGRAARTEQSNNRQQAESITIAMSKRPRGRETRTIPPGELGEGDTKPYLSLQRRLAK